MTYPSWWMEGAEEVITQAKNSKLVAKDASYPIDKKGLESLKLDLEAKSSEGKAYLLADDCRKLIDWRDGGK